MSGLACNQMIVQYIIGLNFMGRVLQEPPHERFLRQMEDLVSQISAWPCMKVENGEPMLPRNAFLETGSSLAAKSIAADHLRLFSGPEPLVPPWASVWLERDALLFGSTTDAVRAVYDDWGVQIANAGHEPEDHLGFELSFMGYLLDVMKNNPLAASRSGVTPENALNTFLNESVMAFAPLVLEKASRCAKTPFYKYGCAHALALLENLRKDIASLSHGRHS